MVGYLRTVARATAYRWIFREIARPVGSTIGNSEPRELSNLRAASAVLAEQRRIAEVLDRAEALRAKRRAALAQLDSLTQSLFLDLFGDPARQSERLAAISSARCDIDGGFAFQTSSVEAPELLDAASGSRYQTGKSRTRWLHREYCSTHSRSELRQSDVASRKRCASRLQQT